MEKVCPGWSYLYFDIMIQIILKSRENDEIMLKGDIIKIYFKYFWK